MDATDTSLLLTALSPSETRWGMELADKLPKDVDLTFDEVKILVRLPMERWPQQLLATVRNAIHFGEFPEERPEA